MNIYTINSQFTHDSVVILPGDSVVIPHGERLASVIVDNKQHYKIQSDGALIASLHNNATLINAL